MTTARLIIDSDLFRQLMTELAHRGRGRRESGAFLLTDRNHLADVYPQPVTAVAYYDDLDPTCLTGGITFRAVGYTNLNARCRQDNLRVVADIHSHPAAWVGQSRTDATHPMVALDGHLALIAPRYAAGVTTAAELGIHLRADGDWNSFYGAAAADLMTIRGGGRHDRLGAWWRRLRSALTVWYDRWRSR